MAFLLGADGYFLLGDDGYFLTDGNDEAATLDVDATIISQYSNSPVITQMIHSFSAAVNPQANIDSFYDNVWNIDTAQGYGLDVWGRIVGVSRNLTLPMTGLYTLPDAYFRTLILVRALANISGCSAPVYNKMLAELFPGRGRCYCADLGNMQMLLTFEFILQPIEAAIIRQSGVFQRPSGVGMFLVQVESKAKRWGFAGTGSGTFADSTFYGIPQNAS
jgi:hypothetical protein